jgi:hypothetical protein
VLRVIIFLVALLAASCAKQTTITTTNTYEKAMPFSKPEIKKVEANQEATCTQYSVRLNIRRIRRKEINDIMDDQSLTQQQKKEKHDALMAHLNDGLENTQQFKDKCDALNKKLDEMYEANHAAGDKYLDQRNRK